MHAWSVWSVSLPDGDFLAGATGPHCQGVSAGPVGVGVAVGGADGVAVADGDEAVAVAEAVRPGDGPAVPVCPGDASGRALADVPGAVLPGCGLGPPDAGPVGRLRLAMCPAGITTRSV